MALNDWIDRKHFTTLITRNAYGEAIDYLDTFSAGILPGHEDTITKLLNILRQTCVALVVKREEAKQIESDLRSKLDETLDAIFTITGEVSTPVVETEVITPTPHQADLYVEVIGRLVVWQGNRQVDRWTPLLKHLFKYLVMCHCDYPFRSRHTDKEAIQAYFWPHSGQRQATNNLHRAVSRLRRTLDGNRAGPPFIVFEEDHYFINEEMDIYVDYKAFIAMMSVADSLWMEGAYSDAVRQYEHAYALVGGDPRTFPIGREPGWMSNGDTRLQVQFIKLGDRLLQYYLEQIGAESIPATKLKSCIKLCGEMIRVDGSVEAAHRGLMRCYATQNNIALVHRQYANLESCLAEIDRTPSESTCQLRAQLLGVRSS